MPDCLCRYALQPISKFLYFINKHNARSCYTYIFFHNFFFVLPPFTRPCDRNLRDAELISCRLRRVEPLCRLPGSALQQLAMCGFYEDLEKGVTRKYTQYSTYNLTPYKWLPTVCYSFSCWRTGTLLVCCAGWIAWGAIPCGRQWKQSKWTYLTLENFFCLVFI